MAEEAVDQTSEKFADFYTEERTLLVDGEKVILSEGSEAPWLTAIGVSLVKVYGIRRRGGVVEFGIGNETPPILGWVSLKDFFNEWPD